jgi:hypothetical protein
MCTVTIHRGNNTLVATMNRDEALTRAPEMRPEVIEGPNGIDWIAPRDTERGGTWMGVNNYGVTACLLNAYQPGESLLPDTTGRFRTRGEIVPALLASGDGEAARRWLRESLDPHAYPSFTLLVASPERAVSIEWLGEHGPAVEDLSEEWVLRSSSGWDSADVRRWRETRFAEWRAAGEPHFGALPSFHVLQDPDDRERSPLMQRAWAATRSITQARVMPDEGRVELRYWSEPTSETRDPDAHTSLLLAQSRTLAKAP